MSIELSEYEQRIVDFVESDGCFITAVFDPDQIEPDFAYSIGFPASVGQHDVHISGLELDLMKVLINDTLTLCRDGLVLEDYARTDQLFANCDCIVRKVDPLNLTPKLWSSAIWYQQQYRTLEFDGGYQLVWPDKHGVFPWEAGFDDLSGGCQLQLWEPPIQ